MKRFLVRLRRFGRRIDTAWMKIPKMLRFILKWLAIIVTSPIWIPIMIALSLIAAIAIFVIFGIIDPIMEAYNDYE